MPSRIIDVVIDTTQDKVETIIISVKAAKVAQRGDDGIEKFFCKKITHRSPIVKFKCLRYMGIDNCFWFQKRLDHSRWTSRMYSHFPHMGMCL